jgi:GT2 family glycosyltransferase
MFAVAVMACWDHFHHTRDAITSLHEKAPGHRIHVVAVDNGSTDYTSEYLGSLPDTTVIRNECNTFVTHAWNQGLTAALDMDADAIFLLNNDILAGPGWMEPLERELERYGHDRYFLPHAPFIDPVTFDEDVLEALPKLRGQRTTGKCGWAIFMRPDAVKKFMPIPEDLRVWHNDNWIHYKLVIENGYYREVLLDCVFIHFGGISFRKLGAMLDVSDIVAPDTYAFERLVGMTVTEYVAREEEALAAYRRNNAKS